MAVNPYVNKVEFDGSTLVDLTNDTVTPQTMLAGTTAHDRSGAPITGTVVTASPYASNPAMDGTASPGVSNDYARGDHVHPSDTTKANRVVNPTANTLLVTDANGQPVGTSTDIDALLFDVDAGKNAFMLKDFTQQINANIPPVTQDIANTSIPNIDVDLDVIDPTGVLNTNYAVAALAKYEVYDAASGGNRLNAFPVCSFSMNGQRVLRIRMMVGGTQYKQAYRIAGALLLKHR